MGDTQYTQAGRSRVRQGLKLTFVLALLLLILTLTSCGIIAPCPKEPQKWTVGGTKLEPTDYQKAKIEDDERAQKTSIDIELAGTPLSGAGSGTYMQEQLADAIETPPPKPDDKDPTGVFVRSVSLFPGPGVVWPDRPAYVKIKIQPWRGHDQEPVGGEYELTIKFVPYLITEDTVPDEKMRRALLDPAQEVTDPEAKFEGAVLRAEFVNLYSLADDEDVSCRFRFGAVQEVINRNVLKGIYEALAAQEPLVLPTEPLTSVANQLLTTDPNNPVSTKLVGINVATNTAMKVGFALDKGERHNFDAAVVPLVHNPPGSLPSPVDWGINIDPSFIRAAIDGKVDEAVHLEDPEAVVEHPVDVQFTRGLEVALKGSRPPVCGAPERITFTSLVQVGSSIHKGPDGKSYLIAPSTVTGKAVAGNHILNEACLQVKAWFDTMRMLVHGPPEPKVPPPFPGQVCQNQMGAAINFDAGPDDQFYATGILVGSFGQLLGERFYVAGRSTFMDRTMDRDPAQLTNCTPIGP